MYREEWEDYDEAAVYCYTSGENQMRSWRIGKAKYDGMKALILYNDKQQGWILPMELISELVRQMYYEVNDEPQTS